MFPQSVQPLIKQGLFRPSVYGFPPPASCPSHWTQSWPAGLSCQLPPTFFSGCRAPRHWGLGTSSPGAPPLAEGHLPAAALGSCTPPLLLGFQPQPSPLFSCPRGDFCCCLMYISSSPALCCASVSLLSFTWSPGFPETTPHPHPQPPESHMVRAPCQSPRLLGTSVADHLHTRQGLCLTFLLPLSAPST